ncbi:uncharacterized protein [Emydura macquarii macquarii]|uniref:uncharacterized protein n=1 Tax=Emydura macquarii macquarii TaxID=1129001 RepID=UPI00352A12FF
MRPRRPQHRSTWDVLALQLLLLLLPGAVQGSFEVSVWPEAPMVEHGGSVWINCSSTCRDVSCTGGLETSLRKARSESGSGWVAVYLVNITEWASTPQCYFINGSEIQSVTANISVYRAPEQVVLEPLPKLELGRAYNLTCRVLSVAPVRHLTVTLRRGGQTLYTEMFQNHTKSEADNITVTYQIIPRQQDHGQEVTCHAALDLRPHGSLFQRSSTAQELSVYAFPAPPQLQTSSYLEVGTKATVRCGVAGVFPAGAAHFDLSFGGEHVNFTVTTSGDAATAQAEVESQALGRRELNCTVSVGPVSRSAGTSVLVYSLPEPVLEVNEAQTLVNNNVTVTCRSSDTEPAGGRLQLSDTEQVLASSAWPQVQFQLMAREEDDGREFTCETKLHSFMKRTRTRLSVHYGPRMDNSSCPSNRTWEEGTQQNFSCRARGNPVPDVVCMKDGVRSDIGVPWRVRRENAGTYHCRASNVHGWVAREVIVRVEYTDPDLLLPILLPVALVIVGIIAGVSGWLYYRSRRIRIYRLKQKAQGKPDDQAQLCQNGDAQKAPEAEQSPWRGLGDARSPSPAAAETGLAWREPPSAVPGRPWREAVTGVPGFGSGNPPSLPRGAHVGDLSTGEPLLQGEPTDSGVTGSNVLSPHPLRWDNSTALSARGIVMLNADPRKGRSMRPRRPQHRSAWDVLALLLLLLPGAMQGSFEVSIWPEAPMVEHGGSVWINCSSTCRDVSCRGGLETSLRKAQSESGSGWVAVYFVDITEWASTPQCYFINGSDTQSVTAHISLYRAPEQVVLEPLPELELGRAYNLTCRVLSVAPVRLLTVTLRRGGQTLHTETFQNHTKIEADDITVTHTVTPRLWHHGQEVTCHADLDLRPHGTLFQRGSPAQEIQESVSPTTKLVAIAAVATLAAMLLGILACGLVQQHRTRRETRPEPGEAPHPWLEVEMPPASAEHDTERPPVRCAALPLRGSARLGSAMRRLQLGSPPPGRCLPLLLLLALPGAAQPSFKVSVWPEVSVVEYGGSLWLNCSTTCRDPNATGGLETSLAKAREEAGPGWKARELVNIREWVSAPQCYFHCYTDTMGAQAHITTYRAPEQVVLEPLPELELGRAYNLMCQVLNVAPVRHLNVTLRQGGQTLHTETFQNHNSTTADNITVTHAVTPQRRDHGQEVTCHTALDLRPHGPLFEHSSPAAELRVFAFPAPPQLQTSNYLEVGTKATVRCGVAGVFPAGAAQFDLSFGGEHVNFTVTTSGDAATAQAEVESQAPGRRELNCTVSVGPVSRSAGTSILVYSFPQPVLEIDQPQLLVNSSVTLTCRSPATRPPGVTLQLRDSQQSLASGPQPQLQLTLTARKEDNGRQFTCEGSLPLGSHSIVKNTSAQLAVLYGPEMDDAGCARTQIWVEETEQTLACIAQGNPKPAVVCTRDGAPPYGIGVQQRVAREHAGTYHCDAVNTQGSASREVIVQVEYKPSMDESSCPSTWTWVKGTLQTFSCGADGVPAPEVVCMKDGVLYRLGQGPGIADPTGTYQCNATNPHGSASKTVTVLLEYKPTMDESSCPSTQTWLEGTLHTLACEADGIPAPRIPCSKDGAVLESGGQRNVSRSDAGTYWCTASNRHGSTRKAVAVRVEYRPIILLLAVSPSATVAPGASFSISCSAEGSPAPAYHWTVPPAPNVNYSADNSTVTVAGAGWHNSGVYECLAANAHGQHLGQVQIQVTGNGLRVVVTGIAVVAVLLLGGTAGLIYYLKSTACKKGEYNVQDAENSSKATCLSREMPRDGDIYGIQLTQT